MATRRKAYVDTSAFIAFLDRSDSHHSRFLRLFADPPPLVTSPLVIAEGHAWFLRRFDTARALEFLAFIEDLAPLEVVDVGAGELHDASGWLRRFNDQAITMVDAVGLDLMRRRRITSCWSTDRHLSLGGVPIVIHET
jgi:predicted nucleic acid-binding protein